MGADYFDAVIAGGGLSGLTLAAHLAQNGWGGRSVLVVDDAADDSGEPTRDDRGDRVREDADGACWASWSARPGLLDAAVSRSYRRVRIHAGAVSRVVSLGRYRYRLVRRRDLRRVVTGLLQCHPGFVLRTGRVTKLGTESRGGAGCAEVTVDGRGVDATWAFDSVRGPATSEPDDARMAFTGWRVDCDRPVFDPDTPTLFDFRTCQRGGAHFMYVLPDNRHRALVEFTSFVPRGADPPAPEVARDALAEYVGEVLGIGEYRIPRTETGVLPLRAATTPRADGRVLAIGARGGLIKASTGYGYERIQRDSGAIAASLVRHGHPFDLPSTRRRHRLMDAVLLDVLGRDPAQLERAFARLFAANPADRVLRFLDEDTSVLAEARLALTVPPVPFLRATAARAGRHLGRRTATLSAVSALTERPR